MCVLLLLLYVWLVFYILLSVKSVCSVYKIDELFGDALRAVMM